LSDRLAQNRADVRRQCTSGFDQIAKPAHQSHRERGRLLFAGRFMQVHEHRLPRPTRKIAFEPLPPGPPATHRCTGCRFQRRGGRTKFPLPAWSPPPVLTPDSQSSTACLLQPPARRLNRLAATWLMRCRNHRWAGLGISLAFNSTFDVCQTLFVAQFRCVARRALANRNRQWFVTAAATISLALTASRMTF
jgi:hypothetical protein